MTCKRGMTVEVTQPSENPMLVGVLLPELAHMRNLARLLTFDAHVAAERGDAERAVADIRAMLGVARHAGDRPVLIAGLVQIAIVHLASNTAAQLIHDQRELLSDEQLRTLAHEFSSFAPRNLRSELRGERWVFEDMVQRVYSDDGRGDGHLTYEGLRTLMSFASLQGSAEDFISGPSPLGPIAATVVADRAGLLAKHDELMTMVELRARTPLWEHGAVPSATDAAEALTADPIQRIRYFPILIAMPALDRAAEQGEYVTQWRDGLLTGIALELYRREHGVYPDTLAALTPRYLPEVPPDRYTGGPLSYAVVDGRPRVWSVGVDRDDDGGVMPEPHRDETYRWMSPEEAALRQADPRTGHLYDGDWVVWPVVYEPVKADR